MTRISSQFIVIYQVSELPMGAQFQPPCVSHYRNQMWSLWIVDDIKKEVHMFELTVNWETLCDKNNKYKNDRYAHILTDITIHTPSRTAFEVGVRGQSSKDNMQRLQQIHKFTKPAIKLKTFTNNLSALAVNSSYVIFTFRKQPLWSQTDYPGPPF